ncbi:MAG: glycosyltransferase family 4 protein [Spirochaetaceae bacterium]
MHPATEKPTSATTRPRVGIFTRPIDQGTSGSGHHLLEMVRHILELNEEFEIYLIHYEPNEKPIYRHPGVAGEIIVPRNPFAAARKLAPYGFSLLHHSPLTIYSPLRVPGAARVATIHGAEPNIIPRYYSLQARLHARFIKPRLARRMDHIFTVSETSKRYYAEHWGVDPGRVSITYNACAPAYRRLEPPFEELPALKRLGLDTPYLFHISKHSHRKNPEAIASAFATVARSEEIPGLKLVLAGKGWENESLETRLRDLGVLDRVVFTGFVGEEEVVELFNGAFAFLFPSRAEGFGMPNVEAMACGCPVITSNAFALPEIVGDAALIVEPEDHDALATSILRLHREPELRSQLITKGLDRAASYSWEKSARTVLAVYRQLS